MENVMSNAERNKIINLYLYRLSRSSGELGKYYAEIVDNMTYEDAKKLLEYGVKYGFIAQGDSFKTAFRVVLAYVGEYFKSFNAFGFKKTVSDFSDSHYDYICAQIEYYGNLIEELSDRDNISSIMARSICQCVAEKYPEFANMSLLSNLNNYLVNDTSELLKCKYEYMYNNLSYSKKQLDTQRIELGVKKCYGIRVKETHYISDNHLF